MEKRKILNNAIDFHGHLGPYLILGLLAGNYALTALKAKKHFGVKVKVYGATDKPKSCLIDGLQLTTGATYGKGNIEKFKSRDIKISVFNKESNKSINIKFRNNLLKQLAQAKTHKDCEKLAIEIYGKKPGSLFEIK